jgi:AcrR family transcriptional regulator
VSSFAVPTPAFAQATALDGPARSRVTPADAFARAREVVHGGSRLDMVALAAELGIGRATLYRWTGDRERLLSDILWMDVHALYKHVLGASRERGAERIRVVATRFLMSLATTGYLTTFLHTERETGFRLITDPQGGVRPRLVDVTAAAIQGEVDAGVYLPPDDPRLLADGMVTLGERFLYHGGNVETNPDAETASRMIALLIREPVN